MRRLLTAPCEPATPDEAQRKKKKKKKEVRLYYPASTCISWELLMGFAGDKSLLFGLVPQS